jgi:hypothetical protein
MNRFAWLVLLAPTALAAPLFAAPEPTADELKENRAQLEQWRKFPEQMARLRRDLQAFRAQTETRREQALNLDHDLHLESWAVQTRLRNVLDRYADWLEKLSDKDREAIQSTPTKAARIALIQELRDREWMQGQARAVRERWETLKGDERRSFVHKEREKDRKRQQEWQFAVRFWKPLVDGKTPAGLAELEMRDREGVTEYLLPMLSKDEKQKLASAEGRWPGYIYTLVEIADRHPLALPGSDGPRTFEDLPRAVRERFKIKGKEVFPKQKQGQWPEFGSYVVEQNEKRGKGPLPNELWASNLNSLQRPMKEYVENVLKPVLGSDELEQLQKAHGTWPAYPVTIQELSQAHQLAAPPWQTALPGPGEQWDVYRALSAENLPDVPRQALQDFVLYKLNAEQRAKFSPFDQSTMDRLKAAYFDYLKRTPQWQKGFEHEMHELQIKKGKGSPFPMNPPSKWHDK